MVTPYSVDIQPEAQDGLRRLSKLNAQRILKKIKWLSENFDQVPHEALTGEFRELFKYSVIYTDRLIIIHLIGHRRSVYERR